MTEAVEGSRFAFEAFPEHWQIALRAIERLAADQRVLGLYLAGRSRTRALIAGLTSTSTHHRRGCRGRRVIASQGRPPGEVGDIAASFPATHLGDPIRSSPSAERASRSTSITSTERSAR